MCGGGSQDKVEKAWADAYEADKKREGDRESSRQAHVERLMQASFHPAEDGDGQQDDLTRVAALHLCRQEEQLRRLFVVLAYFAMKCGIPRDFAQLYVRCGRVVVGASCSARQRTHRRVLGSVLWSTIVAGWRAKSCWAWTRQTRRSWLKGRGKRWRANTVASPAWVPSCIAVRPTMCPPWSSRWPRSWCRRSCPCSGRSSWQACRTRTRCRHPKVTPPSMRGGGAVPRRMGVAAAVVYVVAPELRRRLRVLEAARCE